jgi:hypothetical protein
MQTTTENARRERHPDGARRSAKRTRRRDVALASAWLRNLATGGAERTPAQQQPTPRR